MASKLDYLEGGYYNGGAYSIFRSLFRIFKGEQSRDIHPNYLKNQIVLIGRLVCKKPK